MYDPFVAKNILKQVAEEQLSFSETDALPEPPRKPNFLARLFSRSAAQPTTDTAPQSRVEKQKPAHDSV